MLKGGSEAIYVIILIVKCLRNFRVYEIGTKCFEKKFVRRKLQVFFLYWGDSNSTVCQTELFFRRATDMKLSMAILALR